MHKILRAIEVATKAHGMTPRKYAVNGKEMPFIVHPIMVMNKVCMYLDDYESAKRFQHLRKEMLIVAALHDVIEDTNYPKMELEREFGTKVMEGLNWLTNISKMDPNIGRLKRELRKKADFKRLADAPDEWKVIKLWDRVDNLLSMVYAPTDFVLETYIPESNLLLEEIGKADQEVSSKVVSAIEWLKVNHFER